eukprot:1138866-Pelagomonas_calceolata.AAC.6
MSSDQWPLSFCEFKAPKPRDMGKGGEHPSPLGGSLGFSCSEQWWRMTMVAGSNNDSYGNNKRALQMGSQLQAAKHLCA